MSAKKDKKTKVIPQNIKVESKNEAQQDFLELLRSPLDVFPLVVTFGPAGTGKTFLAVYDAIKRIRSKEVDQIIITRAAVAAEDTGFLPGNASEKAAPYLVPVLNCFKKLAPLEWRQWQAEGRLQIYPLGYMRGDTLERAYIIVDEFQNIAQDLFKMLLTRIGEGSRCVLSGDPDQIDLKPKRLSAAHWLEMFFDQEHRGIAIYEFLAEDTVRSTICRNILELFRENGV